MKIKRIIILSTILGMLSGCASIVGNSSDSVTISSNTDDVEVVIKNRKGLPIYQGYAPTSVSLKKKAGFFSGETYSIFARKNGYKTQTIQLDTGLSGWYWGNILLGGLIGMLIVDPATGSMWTFDEDIIYLDMQRIR